MEVLDDSAAFHDRFLRRISLLNERRIMKKQTINTRRKTSCTRRTRDVHVNALNEQTHGSEITNQGTAMKSYSIMFNRCIFDSYASVHGTCRPRQDLVQRAGMDLPSNHRHTVSARRQIRAPLGTWAVLYLGVQVGYKLSSNVLSLN